MAFELTGVLSTVCGVGWAVIAVQVLNSFSFLVYGRHYSHLTDFDACFSRMYGLGEKVLAEYCDG
jgi:hypothetical protein